MAIAGGLIVARFVHYVAVSVLFGGALFPFYGIVSTSEEPLLRLRWLRPFLLASALLALASGIAWSILSGAGAGWSLRLLLNAGLVLLLLHPRALAWRSHVVVGGSLLLLASLALAGHAGNDTSTAAIPHRIIDAVHLIASGIWIGALAVLAWLVVAAGRTHREGDLQILHHALSRFSGIGLVVVATLVLSGMLNPGFASRLETAYGQVLLAKLIVFGLMLLLAAANRYWLTDPLSGLEPAPRVHIAVRALQASILIETALGVLVLFLVGWLGTLPPPAPG